MQTLPPSDFAAALTEFVADKLMPAMDACGAEWADDLREDLSIPVGRDGGKIVRSKPGEKPRKEWGDYVATVSHETRREGNNVTTEIGSTSELGEWLEGGTSHMEARPHIGPLRDQIVAEGQQKITSKL